MSVGFGFSVGDFIAALKVVSDVIDALRKSSNSTAESRSLLLQLYDLKVALTLVRGLELDEAQADQLHALRRAALQCRSTIDHFTKKITKHQPHLHSSFNATSLLIKQSWYKVKWALCRKEDIEKFKADLVGHTEAITILLNAISIQQMSLESRTRDNQHSSLKTIIGDCYYKTMHKLSAIADTVTNTLSQTKQLLEITARTASIDCKMFSVILDIQDILRRSVAPQILRAQPVYFVDALGIPSPFHLEFIRSRDAFISVLRCNMKGNEMAVRRIDRGGFAVSDTVTKRDINLSSPWHMCFRPGQKVDMSMIMQTQKISTSSCPSCKAECSTDSDSDVVCSDCGLTFRRLTEMNEPTLQTPDLNDGYDSLTTFPDTEEPNKKRKREEDISQELTMYRKIRLWQPSTEDVISMHDLFKPWPDIIETAIASGEFDSSYPSEQAQSDPSQVSNVHSNTGSHALQDYQMQLMLLEQQNKKRQMMARQEIRKPGFQKTTSSASRVAVSNSIHSEPIKHTNWNATAKTLRQGTPKNSRSDVHPTRQSMVTTDKRQAFGHPGPSQTPVIQRLPET